MRGLRRERPHLHLLEHRLLRLGVLAPGVLRELHRLVQRVRDHDVVEDGPRLHLPQLKGHVLQGGQLVELRIVHKVGVRNQRRRPHPLHSPARPLVVDGGRSESSHRGWSTPAPWRTSTPLSVTKGTLHACMHDGVAQSAVHQHGRSTTWTSRCAGAITGLHHRRA